MLQSFGTRKSVCHTVATDFLALIVIHSAGQDATEVFYGLHRHEVILKSQYARLQIGVIDGEESTIIGRVSGQLSTVPYAEPTWLADGYYSPTIKRYAHHSFSPERIVVEQ